METVALFSGDWAMVVVGGERLVLAGDSVTIGAVKGCLMALAAGRCG